MKKCVNCGGNNSDIEVFCDWCGEKLFPEKKMNLFLFLKYYFHSFAILGILGAIIYYIASFLINENNEKYLAEKFYALDVTVGNALQFGLFVCFCFFILLLILLIFEIVNIRKSSLSLKFLMMILLLFLFFTTFLFLLVGLNWLQLIILLITLTITFACYYHFLDSYVISETNGQIKIRNSFILTAISSFILLIFIVASQLIQSIVDNIGTTQLFFENEPTFLLTVLNGFFVGLLFGIILGLLLYGIFLIINGFKVIFNELF